jgi:hypothetical protein
MAAGNMLHNCPQKKLLAYICWVKNVGQHVF